MYSEALGIVKPLRLIDIFAGFVFPPPSRQPDQQRVAQIQPCIAKNYLQYAPPLHNIPLHST
jgi:hypothetical protein